MKMPSYRACAVPLCKNTTIKVPNKLFIHVPNNCPKRRKKWLQLAHRDPKLTSEKAPIFFCEDHFDLPNDMENYMEYIIMGSVSRIRMKPDCLPLKYECQAHRKNHSAHPHRKTGRKRLHMDLIKEIPSKDAEISATPGDSTRDFQPITEDSLPPAKLVSVEVVRVKEEPQWDDKIDTQTFNIEYGVKEEWEDKMASRPGLYTKDETEGAQGGNILCEVNGVAVCPSLHTETLETEDGEPGCVLYEVKTEFASGMSEQCAHTANEDLVLGL